MPLPIVSACPVSVMRALTCEAAAKEAKPVQLTGQLIENRFLTRCRQRLIVIETDGARLDRVAQLAELAVADILHAGKIEIRRAARQGSAGNAGASQPD